MAEELTKLDQNDEWRFREWYRDWAQRIGINPDPDDPLHYYDYRAAWKAGAAPAWNEELKQYKWSSDYKTEGHPNLIVDGINTKTGKPVR